MRSLFLLDPIPRSVWALATSDRRDLFESLARLLRSERRPSDRQVCTYRLSGGSRYSDLGVAFTQFAGRLVILQLARHFNELRHDQLQMDVETLEKMDLSSLGLFIDTGPEEPNFASSLERAVSIYCRSNRHAAPSILHWAGHGAREDEEVVLGLVNRLTGARRTPWPSSEARQKFKEVLDRAERDPQVIERGGQRFLVVEESRLPTLIGRRNATEMYRELFEEAEPIERFERIPGRTPGRLLELS